MKFLKWLSFVRALDNILILTLNLDSFNPSFVVNVIDFGNGSNLEDEVIVSIDSGNNQKPHVKLYDTMGSTKAMCVLNYLLLIWANKVGQ